VALENGLAVPRLKHHNTESNAAAIAVGKSLRACDNAATSVITLQHLKGGSLGLGGSRRSLGPPEI
jgi:hypothetical protein